MEGQRTKDEGKQTTMINVSTKRHGQRQGRRRRKNEKKKHPF